MKISLNWIKDYVNHGLSTEKLSHKLTMAGTETEEIVKVGNDTVMEFEITPNRADCLSMIGMAREIATVTQKKLQTPKIKKLLLPKKKFPIKIESTKDCAQYIGTVIEGVNVKSAPIDIQKRISVLGNKPISNLVDITNFVLFEQGQPLHAFDLDKLEGGKIVVRRAKKGESIVAIDGQTYKLDPSILVIADAKKPVAIAGIMGGKATEVGPHTKNILLESAYFNPILTRRASRKLGLSSDSSYRFERGVDFEGVQRASVRATQLILEQAGGTSTHYAQAGLNKSPFVRKPVMISVERINGYLGTTISATKIKSILTSLEFKVIAQGKNLKVTPPSFRSDIHQDVDIIEEIGRVMGYDTLPTSLPTVPTTQINVHAPRQLRNRMREILIGQGLNEAITFTLMSEEDLKRSGWKDIKALSLVNPLSLDQAIMKPSMLPSLLSVARGNINKGQKDIRLFELGKVYTVQAKEKEVAAFIFSGNHAFDWRSGKKAVDIFDLKGSLQHVFARLNLDQISVQKQTYDIFDAQESTTVFSGKKEIGCLGKISRDILRAWDIKDADVYFAEIAIPDPKVQKKKTFEPISEYPAIVQDVSLAVKDDVSFENIEALCWANGSDLLKDIRFHELYMGEKIPAGQRGVVFSCIYQSRERTLREEDVLKVHEAMVQKLISELGAVRR